MGAAQTDKWSAAGKGGLIAAFILGAVLFIASIWSLSRALNNSSPHGSVALTNATTTMNTALIQEELPSQPDMAAQRTVPVIRAPVAEQPAVIPNKQHDDEVKLQKARAKVNQRIVERMKQYVRDNPKLDTRDLEEQIKRRENQGVPSP